MDKHAAPAGTTLRVSRREVLYYAWGAAFALLSAAFGRMIYLFALPRPRDVIGLLPLERIPARGAAPELIELFGRPIFLTHTSAGVNALRADCTHNGCRLLWSNDAGVFACPCHGSHFDMNGEYVSGPAPRALDRYALVTIEPSGKSVTHAAMPLKLPAQLSMLAINLDQLVPGKSHGHLGDGVIATAVPAGNLEQYAPVP